MKGLHRINGFDIQARSRELVERGGKVYSLPRGIKSKSEFFDAIRHAMPLDPPLVGERSWDALSDSLWSGLDQVNAQEIAIIWPDSDAMAQADPEEFETAKSILSDVAESLADIDATVGNAKQVLVVLT